MINDPLASRVEVLDDKAASCARRPLAAWPCAVFD